MVDFFAIKLIGCHVSRKKESVAMVWWFHGWTVSSILKKEEIKNENLKWVDITIKKKFLPGHITRETVGLINC